MCTIMSIGLGIVAASVGAMIIAAVSVFVWAVFK